MKMFAASALEHDLLTFNLIPSKTWHRFIVAASENLIYLPWLLCSRHVGSEWMRVLHICSTAVHFKSQNSVLENYKLKLWINMPMLCGFVFIEAWFQSKFYIHLGGFSTSWTAIVGFSLKCQNWILLSLMNSQIFDNIVL